MTVLSAHSSQGSAVMEDQFEKKRSFLYKKIQLKSPNLIKESESVDHSHDSSSMMPPTVSEKMDETNCNKKIYDFLSPNAFETDNEFADTQVCLSKRSRSIQEAKNAFLISTISQVVNNETPFYTATPVLEKIYLGVTKSPVIGVKSKSEDSRVTGGGEESGPQEDTQGEIEINNRTNVVKVFESKVKNKRLEEVQAVRKVSFKVKNFPPPYRRTGAVTSKTTTLNSNKVTELTNKFNEMVKENDSILKTPKFAKAIEYIQNNKHKASISTSSSVSSTVSANLNVKIILRHKNSVKRHNLKKKCSSVDSIDKLSSHEYLKQQRKVNRTKSDGVQKGKTQKPKLPISGNKESVRNKISCDVVDGVKCADDESCEVDKKPVSRMPPARQVSLVKEAIQKFETGIAVQKPTKSAEASITVKLFTENNTQQLKPKIPEKKLSLTLTKNVVVRDGKPKIKTLKQRSTNQTDEPLSVKQESIPSQEEFKVKEKLRKKGQFYEKSKFKTNYIHTEKLSLKAVEIVNDLTEPSPPILEPETDTITTTINDDEKHYQELSVNLRPNESFLWGCNKVRLSSADSNTGIYKESLYESTYAEKYFDTCSDNVSFETINQDHKDYQDPEMRSLVEAINNTICNNEVTVVCQNSSQIVDNHEQVKEEEIEASSNLNVMENDYELLEPVENQPLISTKSESRINIMNLPLPEIPLDPGTPVKQESPHENIYQCLLEMRSHPEGDECSIHSYEFCENNMEERTRGDGDSDDGYEYCRSPNLIPVASPESEQSSETIKPLPPKRNTDTINRRIEICKSSSTTSATSYEKIGEPCIYEKIPPRPYKPKDLLNISPSWKRDSLISTDTRNYNEGENIYDTIKHPDGVSISNCYESIPNSPHSVVKLRENPKTRYVSGVNKRLSFDRVSNVSQCTTSSDQKTNSIYGQRSVISFGGQEIAFQVPNSETSVSDRSDHSDDWVDISDPEEDKTNDSTIIIVERGRGRKSPISWSQKVRHQWLKSPKRIRPTNDGDSSDSGHYYESLNVDSASRGAVPSPLPIDDDFDSFDSDSEDELPVERPNKNDSGVDLGNTRLPDPPPSNVYTLTKFATAAGKKMRELKRNFTRKYSASAESNKTGSKSPPANGMSKTKPKQQSEGNIYQNMYFPEPVLQSRYSIPQIVKKSPPPLINTDKTDPPTPPIASVYDVAFNRELKNALNEKKINGSAYTNIVPPDTQKLSPYVQLDMSKGKDSGTLSRKTYFSFKSRFRRCSSMAIDINSVPSALKITNSTFYLTDSIDGDSGFSNCSDSGQIANSGSSEALQPILPARKRNKATESGSDKPLVNNHQHTKYESSPNLSAYNIAVTEDRHKYIVRPMSPPPPPPDHHTAMNAELKRLLPTLARKDKRPGNRSSWYAEAGVGDPNEAQKPISNGGKDRPSSTSWYAEVGLYQAGNISTSSGASSGASDPASLPATPTPKHYGLFTQEPLYQFYNADKVKSACQNMTDSDSDGYEEVRLMMIKKKAEMQECRPSAMALVSPQKGPSRTLWSEIPEVLNSAVLSSLSANQRKLQEAKFEIVTSEASYLNSLNVLKSHFISHPAFNDENVLCKTDRDILFGSIIPVKRCSQLFMNEMEKCWQENILLHGLCDIVKQHAEKHFDVYIKYCENQIFLVKAMQRLKAKGTFTEVLGQMENHQACQSLSLHSFLMLPMQRATRLPLLMDAVLKHLDPADDEYQSCMDALATLNHFVSQCNEGARNMERVEEMYRITSSIEFPSHMKQSPELGPSCSLPSRAPGSTPRGTIGTSLGPIGAPRRWLVRSGELTQLVWRGDEQLKLTFGKKFQKNPLWLFLFTDLLVITKKRSEDSYVVVDYCQRSLIEMSSGDVMGQLHMKETPGKHVMLLTLLENYENKTVEMLMSCSTETDRQRWMEAFAAPSSSNPEETLYAGWDCPQVAAIFPYCPSQPDELALHEGDIVNVNKKMMDGWYHGERIRDGEVGWFPGNYTIEIASAHVRARNLRQRYRLLALSGTYLGQKKKTT